MSYEEMQEAIRLERRIELAFEGHRFFDVRRWMIAETTQNQQMYGYKITRSTNGVEKVKKCQCVNILSEKLCIFSLFLIKKL